MTCIDPKKFKKLMAGVPLGLLLFSLSAFGNIRPGGKIMGFRFEACGSQACYRLTGDRASAGRLVSSYSVDNSTLLVFDKGTHHILQSIPVSQAYVDFDLGKILLRGLGASGQDGYLEISSGELIRLKSH